MSVSLQARSLVLLGELPKLQQEAHALLTELAFSNADIQKASTDLPTKSKEHQQLASNRTQELVRSSPHDFAILRKKYGPCIIDMLRQEVSKNTNDVTTTTTTTDIATDSPAGPSNTTKGLDSAIFVDFEDDDGIVLCAARSASRNADKLVQETLASIDDWVAKNKYDQLVECVCCYDSCDKTKGLACANGHFFCSVQGCLERAIDTQLSEFSFRDGDSLLCQVCQGPYSMDDIASHISGKLHEIVQEIITEKKQNRSPTTRTEPKEQAGNVATDGSQPSPADQLKADAQKKALEICNSTLNLSCPHCHVAYVDFTGCVAIECSKCKGYFCGYCHAKATSWNHAHTLVETCPMNEKPGDPYGSPEIIKRVQKKYRIGKLKASLQQYGKEMQTAVLTELGKELSALDIQTSEVLHE